MPLPRSLWCRRSCSHCNYFDSSPDKCRLLYSYNTCNAEAVTFNNGRLGQGTACGYTALRVKVREHVPGLLRTGLNTGHVCDDIVTEEKCANAALNALCAKVSAKCTGWSKNIPVPNYHKMYQTLLMSANEIRIFFVRLNFHRGTTLYNTNITLPLSQLQAQ